VTGRHQEEGRRARHKLKRPVCEKKQVTEDIWSTDQAYNGNTSRKKKKRKAWISANPYTGGITNKLRNAMLGKIVGMNDR